MTLPQMLEDLPKSCDVGMKKNARGLVEKWIGYKLHIDTADGGIPISCAITSASTHDSQAAIPLGTLTARWVENLYDLMDSAYDSVEILAHGMSLGHKPIIAVNPRRSVAMKEALKLEKKARRTLGFVFPEELRYVERSASERLNGRLKDEFGGRYVRVRGYDKVWTWGSWFRVLSGRLEGRYSAPIEADRRAGGGWRPACRDQPRCPTMSR